MIKGRKTFWVLMRGNGEIDWDDSWYPDRNSAIRRLYPSRKMAEDSLSQLIEEFPDMYTTMVKVSGLDDCVV